MSEVPTTSGLYWWRCNKRAPWEPVNVITFSDPQYQDSVQRLESNQFWKLNTIGGIFGPRIEPPADSEPAAKEVQE